MYWHVRLQVTQVSDNLHMRGQCWRHLCHDQWRAVASGIRHWECKRTYASSHLFTFSFWWGGDEEERFTDFFIFIYIFVESGDLTYTSWIAELHGTGTHQSLESTPKPQKLHFIQSLQDSSNVYPTTFISYFIISYLLIYYTFFSYLLYNG